MITDLRTYLLANRWTWIVGGALALVVWSVGLAVAFHHAGVSDERTRQAIASAKLQAHVDTAISTATTHVTETTAQATQKADDAVQQIHKAPGAATPVDPDVLAGWRSGLDSVRASSGSGQAHR